MQFIDFFFILCCATYVVDLWAVYDKKYVLNGAG